MSKRKVLLQLDGDRQPSVFDAVVAIDADVDHLLRHHEVTPETVRELVHGAMFTRGVDQLHHTAVFIGGSDVAQAERLLEAVCKCFLGPLRVSVMLDAGGANTTAAAAVLAAARHVNLSGATAAVLGATGPVGSRAVRLLARQGANVRAGSRAMPRAEAVCERVRGQVDGANVAPHQTATDVETATMLDGADLLIAAGAAGAMLASGETLQRCGSLRVAIDLNAVPPAGLEGVEVTDKAAERHGITCYGAVGVGGAKMKIHRAALRQLFADNRQVLDAEEIYQIGRKIAG